MYCLGEWVGNFGKFSVKKSYYPQNILEGEGFIGCSSLSVSVYPIGDVFSGVAVVSSSFDGLSSKMTHYPLSP